MTASYRVIRGGGADIDDLLWAEPFIADFGRVAKDVADEWRYRKKRNRSAGNTWLREIHTLLMNTPKVVRDVHKTEDLDKIARWLADECIKFTTDAELDDFRARHELPEVPGQDTGPRLLRAKDWQFWRRQLRKPVSQYRDQMMRHIGLVHRHKQIYCSDHCLALFRQRQRANQRVLEDITMVNDELGVDCTLTEAAEASVANPEKRRLELMTRISGMERYAQEEGHRAVFITLTCPSAYHAHHSDGSRNRKWNGCTPREANDYLCGVWDHIRPSLDHKRVERYGFRMVEPHHDGTPHWHLILFVPLRDAKALQDTIKHYALKEDGDEPGARKHRVTFEWIDPEKGSATGYAVKYVAKNVDGHAVGDDLYGNDAEAVADRIVAWARTWAIRQFQQIGGPSVTAWREYRRLREQRAVSTPHITPWLHASAPGDLKPNWCGFMRCMGGHMPGRKQPTRIIRGQRWCSITGECTPPVNKYGEPVEGNALPVIGLQREGVYIRTRIGFWRREWSETAEEHACTPPGYPVITSATERIRTQNSIETVRKHPSASDRLFATITATGARLTGLPQGMTIPAKYAHHLPQPVESSGPVARWTLIRDGEAVAPWTRDNNCRFENDGAGNRRGPPL